MATKANEKLQDGSTWNKAAEDEPLFILRPTDKFAVLVINLWINLAILMRVNDAKINEAIELRNQVDVWQRAHATDGKVKVPD